MDRKELEDLRVLNSGDRDIKLRPCKESGCQSKEMPWSDILIWQKEMTVMFLDTERERERLNQVKSKTANNWIIFMPRQLITHFLKACSACVNYYYPDVVLSVRKGLRIIKWKLGLLFWKTLKMFRNSRRRCGRARLHNLWFDSAFVAFSSSFAPVLQTSAFDSVYCTTPMSCIRPG